MSGLEVEILSEEDAVKYVQENPNKALGRLIWNHIQFKEKYESDSRRRWLRNTFMQTGGGMAGGAAAVYALWLAAKDYIVIAVAEYLRKAGS